MESTTATGSSTNGDSLVIKPDHADVLVVARRLERGDQLAEQLDRERVAGFGVVERDRRDVLGDLVANLLELGHE